MADVRLTATNPEDSSVVPVACNAKGELKLEEIPDQSFDGNLQGNLTVSGSATFAEDVLIDDSSSGVGLSLTNNAVVNNNSINGSGIIVGEAAVRPAIATGVPDTNGSISFGTTDNPWGSATFAGNKAGFTAEGHLWCTTRRNDTVILDATSNGLASWVPYTPPSRLTELQDKWAEKDGILPVPHESSQDEPETKQ